jgi:hypothetical protein
MFQVNQRARLGDERGKTHVGEWGKKKIKSKNESFF